MPIDFRPAYTGEQIRRGVNTKLRVGDEVYDMSDPGDAFEYFLDHEPEKYQRLLTRLGIPPEEAEAWNALQLNLTGKTYRKYTKTDAN